MIRELNSCSSARWARDKSHLVLAALRALGGWASQDELMTYTGSQGKDGGRVGSCSHLLPPNQGL